MIIEAQKALALMGSSTHLTGDLKLAAQILEFQIAEETDEPVSEVRDWAARANAWIQVHGSSEILKQIDSGVVTLDLGKAVKQ